ncbi:hypothetical protein GCM10010969_07420 [Saccharibacillus kuerlensis]|uniref:Uncharacterized protein n=1 Tax=Saccharibacillus kuerlensis TaxID=459527 RepID=A0ABQ2KV02_9BACL|nr:hypothetical protein GCM10010969_07420 [Saccharibacillus kuerlensis]
MNRRVNSIGLDGTGILLFNLKTYIQVYQREESDVNEYRLFAVFFNCNDFHKKVFFYLNLAKIVFYYQTLL